jgi:hypothetical protein
VACLTSGEGRGRSRRRYGCSFCVESGKETKPRNSNHTFSVNQHDQSSQKTGMEFSFRPSGTIGAVENWLSIVVQVPERATTKTIAHRRTRTWSLILSRWRSRSLEHARAATTPSNTSASRHSHRRCSGQWSSRCPKALLAAGRTVNRSQVFRRAVSDRGIARWCFSPLRHLLRALSWSDGSTSASFQGPASSEYGRTSIPLPVFPPYWRLNFQL